MNDRLADSGVPCASWAGSAGCVLAERLTQLHRHCARQDVVAATRREGHDDADGLDGIGLRQNTGARGEPHHGD